MAKSALEVMLNKTTATAILLDGSDCLIDCAVRDCTIVFGDLTIDKRVVVRWVG